MGPHLCLVSMEGIRGACLKRIIVIFLGCIFAAGCSKISHLDQLLTLKGLADEQEILNQHVQEQDKYFDLMLAEVRAGTLGRYAQKRDILAAFRDPVFVRDAVEGEEELELCLYRYATQYFGAEKVYLYFDTKGNLVRSKYVEGDGGQSGQETAPEDGREEI